MFRLPTVYEAVGKVRGSVPRLLKLAAFSSVDGHYTGPNMKTSVPGPKSKVLQQELLSVRHSPETMFFVDYQRSYGNYVCDADGNVMLDLFQQISSLPLGYNHPAIAASLREEGALLSLVNRPALSAFPPVDLAERISNSLLKVAPRGLNKVCTLMCGTCSNENAFKAAFIRYMNKKRGGPPDLSDPKYADTIMNKGPGCPNLSILSFENGFHGRALGTLACTHTKIIHKLDIPALQWPIAPFPQLQYPLDQFQEENRDEEHRCLVKVEEEFQKAAESGAPVAGVIVEPIQAEGGDKHASSTFFRELQSLCNKYDAALIVDEVQTGGGSTGHFWCHESWDLPEPPTFVTFAKKVLTGGFYYSDHEDVEAYRIFNTYMGDHVRLVTLEAVVKEIQNKNLIAQVQRSGETLQKGLQSLTDAYPHLIQNARGQGTFCAIDAKSADIRNKVVSLSRDSGVNIAGSGELSIRLRPALILEDTHVKIFLELFQQVLQKM